ncbi:MAG: pilus assembly protein PilM [Candidatus Omnitrophica bacterium]|nr:pilus assembly protein PilM [Candidatus Omnitrophota bacterium]
MKRQTSDFGIYFGTEVISITEVKRKKAVSNIIIPHSRITALGAEQRLPDKFKIVAALRDDFVKNDLSPDYVNITLAGEDLIIRTFELPIFLSRKELEYGAIAFEAKKYIPFLIEELVFDFKLYKDQKNKKILVLFVGIKKDMLNSYLAIFKQLHMQPKFIEYAGFSLFRILNLIGEKDKGCLGLLSVGLEEETNFLVYQNGFPFFSRDISLIPMSESRSTAEEISNGKIKKLTSTAKIIFLERLKSEMRISLDFFRRKFPTKPLEKVVVLSDLHLQAEITGMIKDLGLSVVDVDLSKLISENLPTSCALAKSYSAAIGARVKLRFPIDLLKPAVKKEHVKGFSLQAFPISLSDFKVSPKVIIMALLIIGVVFMWGIYRKIPLEKDIELIKIMQPKVEGIVPESSLSAITGFQENLLNKVNIMEGIVSGRVYFTEVLNLLPKVMPRGAWLTSIQFRNAKKTIELNFEGIVVLENPEKEFAAVSDIVLGLRSAPNFSNIFEDIEVVSMETFTLRKIELEATKFTILCRREIK